MADKYNNIERNMCGRFGEKAIDREITWKLLFRWAAYPF